MRKRNFLICGLTGWCMEIIFTSMKSLFTHDYHLMGHTSLWMFPIYGMASLVVPVYKKIFRWPVICRGALYGAGIMFGEYVTGTVLGHYGVCPWDYSGSPYSIKGVIRLDYYPFWIAAGLVFERLLWQPEFCKTEQKAPCGQGTQTNSARN